MTRTDPNALASSAPPSWWTLVGLLVILALAPACSDRTIDCESDSDCPDGSHCLFVTQSDESNRCVETEGGSGGGATPDDDMCAGMCGEDSYYDDGYDDSYYDDTAGPGPHTYEPDTWDDAAGPDDDWDEGGPPDAALECLPGNSVLRILIPNFLKPCWNNDDCYDPAGADPNALLCFRPPGYEAGFCTASCVEGPHICDELANFSGESFACFGSPEPDGEGCVPESCWDFIRQ